VFPGSIPRSRRSLGVPAALPGVLALGYLDGLACKGTFGGRCVDWPRSSRRHGATRPSTARLRRRLHQLALGALTPRLGEDELRVGGQTLEVDADTQQGRDALSAPAEPRERLRGRGEKRALRRAQEARAEPARDGGV